MSRRKALHQALGELARAWNIQLTYENDRGQRRRANTDALLGVLRARGAPVNSLDDVPDALRARRARRAERVLEPVVVAWDGRLPTVPVRVGRGSRRLPVSLELETGEIRAWDIAARDAEASVRVRDVLPAGRHRLRVEAGGREHEAWILSAPRTASPLPGAQSGAFAPLYALARDGQCCGTYGDLHTLARELQERGADIVATLPLLATFLDAPFDASPYAPASRLFWNELYVDALALGARPDAEQKRARAACARQPVIDYAAAAALQRSLLQPLADRALGDGPGADAAALTFARRADVADYARFRAVGERHRKGWRAWPARLRNGRIRDDDFDGADARYHAYVQWAAEAQIEAIANDPAAAGLYLDMPLGVHADSYDTWRHRELFASGASAGAPPDALFRGGQDWGFPPLDPDALRSDGYGYFAAALQHQLRIARVLRLDHVMSLYRLYWIPDGTPATDGVYVRYPADEMFAVLTLESARSRAAIVGEDLGTVPAAVRRRLEKHAVQRMFVVQYEVSADRRPAMGQPPLRSAASLNTHDMPTFAGFWAGTDIADLRDLGLVELAGEQAAHAERQRLRAALARHLHLPAAAAQADAPAPVLEALLTWLARSRAALALVGLEDLWLEDRPQNVPGTGPERRPNWRRRFRYPFPDVLRRADVSRRLDQFLAQRRQPDLQEPE